MPKSFDQARDFLAQAHLATILNGKSGPLVSISKWTKVAEASQVKIPLAAMPARCAPSTGQAVAAADRNTLLNHIIS